MDQEQFLNKTLIPQEIGSLKRQPVLVALSGGADSVALLRVLLQARVHCHAAHCNFHLRGEESMRDERFVRALCQQLDVPLTVKDFDVDAWRQSHGGSVEMACRELRYNWFEQLREQEGCQLIAVAHHVNDQVETFFLNLLRGTGIKGLAGMKSMSRNIWRPLLSVSREDILDYLKCIGQDYVTDSTNAANDYRRNRLRNIILPLIGEHFPNAQARILDTMSNLSHDHDLLEQLVEDSIPNLDDIDIHKLCGYPHAPTLLYHRIRHLGFNRDQCIQAIEAARQGHSGRQFIAGSHLLVVNRKSLAVLQAEPLDKAECPFDPALGTNAPVPISVHRGNTPFSPQMCDGKRKVAFNAKLLDSSRIVLRHWRQGDRIQPYGMRGSKLVSDLFADAKLDHAAKQSSWLLEADGTIIWVVGIRSTAHFPVDIGSQDYLILNLDT